MSSEHKAWSKNQAHRTLEVLREKYPRYTDNELYAIWCRDEDRIPLDEDGKVLLEEWLIHAAGDGKHVYEDGFKVSRPLFGRAKKAQKGVPKPVGKPRGRAAKAAAEATEVLPPGEAQAPPGQVLSHDALVLARRYDRAAAALDAIRPLYRQLEPLRETLLDAGPALLIELAQRDEEAAAIVDELVLGVEEGLEDEGEPINGELH